MNLKIKMNSLQGNIFHLKDPKAFKIMDKLATLFYMDFKARLSNIVDSNSLVLNLAYFSRLNAEVFQ